MYSRHKYASYNYMVRPIKDLLRDLDLHRDSANIFTPEWT